MTNNEVKTVGGFKGFLILLVIVLIFSGIGVFIIYNTYRNQQATKNYVTTVGVVVDYKEKYDPADDGEYYDPYFNSSYVYAPIVEYKVDGKYYEVSSKEYTRTPPYEGSPMEVSYDPNKPSRAVVDKTMGSIKDYAIGIIVTLTGPAIIIIGIVFKKKMEK